jgi:putative acetyltransferase
MIVDATEDMFAEIMAVWEASVRATHHFIPEDYIQGIKTLLPGILPQVRLMVYRSQGQVWVFAGVAEQKLEMLFVLPGQQGKGIGRELLLYCMQQWQVNLVDVNEQNEAAVGFYKKMGFNVYNTKPVDGMGKPYPILEMKRDN